MTFELINKATANTLAAFDSEREAQRALRRFAQSDPGFAEQLVVVAFDNEGMAQDGGASSRLGDWFSAAEAGVRHALGGESESVTVRRSRLRT
jgi:hypothetical protein